ncbi:hypothetical protein [Pedobacter africanus]|uniref:Uncharacterized protein n=1 Tax=Pedobacter africanus TaxID=151894 RepID=A0A1W2CUW1_9SPHI|nr:hypothetical protein [Pedobacter africanus]SMC88682.1 hypothetical protein SAMN04488524_3220 [Pedobacter africanus]
MKHKPKEPLFAQVGFPDKQTVLSIYGHMPAKKLKAIVEAINKVIKENRNNAIKTQS